ncbi:MAG: M55 family metallopeptidase [Firmicutes bacterium]|jgi:D-aminopeptidase|nr:M55 family metallopeptidase [Bacillota bacterium]MCL5972262.1 M55 family metallopeptidase [Bacillota bacterium]
MEEIAGVTGRSGVSWGTDEYQRFRKLMTEEADAVGLW